jgi:hypothetical protein
MLSGRKVKALWLKEMCITTFEAARATTGMSSRPCCEKSTAVSDMDILRECLSSVLTDCLGDRRGLIGTIATEMGSDIVDLLSLSLAFFFLSFCAVWLFGSAEWNVLWCWAFFSSKEGSVFGLLGTRVGPLCPCRASAGEAERPSRMG